MNITHEKFKELFKAVNIKKLNELIFTFGEQKVLNLLFHIQHPEYIKQPYVWIEKKLTSKNYTPSYKKPFFKR